MIIKGRTLFFLEFYYKFWIEKKKNFQEKNVILWKVKIKRVRILQKSLNSEEKEVWIQRLSELIFWRRLLSSSSHNRDDTIKCVVAVPCRGDRSPSVPLDNYDISDSTWRQRSRHSTDSDRCNRCSSVSFMWLDAATFFLGPGLGVVGGSCGTEIAPVRCNFTHRLRLQRNQNTEVQKHTNVDRKCFSVFVLCSSLIPKINMLMCIYKVLQENFICM